MRRYAGRCPARTGSFLFLMSLGWVSSNSPNVILGGIGIPPSQLLFLLIMPSGWVSSNSPNVILGGIGISSSYLLFWAESEFHPPNTIFGGIGIPPSQTISRQYTGKLPGTHRFVSVDNPQLLKGCRLVSSPKSHPQPRQGYGIEE